MLNLLRSYFICSLKRTANFDHAMYDEVNVHTRNPSLTWEDLKFLKTFTKMPIVLKGILTGEQVLLCSSFISCSVSDHIPSLTAEDAKLAVEAGVDGIVVSNHGGRQLDTVPAPVSHVSISNAHQKLALCS